MLAEALQRLREMAVPKRTKPLLSPGLDGTTREVRLHLRLRSPVSERLDCQWTVGAPPHEYWDIVRCVPPLWPRGPSWLRGGPGAETVVEDGGGHEVHVVNGQPCVGPVRRVGHDLAANRNPESGPSPQRRTWSGPLASPRAREHRSPVWLSATPKTMPWDQSRDLRARELQSDQNKLSRHAQ